MIRGSSNGAAAIGLLLALAPLTGYAQTALYVAHGDKFLLVRDVQGLTPLVEMDGKLVRVPADHYSLQNVDEYFPIVVTVENLVFRYRWGTFRGGSAAGAKINKKLEVSAQFESPSSLEHVFLVFDLNSEEAGKEILIQQLGDMTARKPKWLKMAVPISEDLGHGKFKMRVYSDGRELLTSKMPFAYRERVITRMVAERIKGAGDGPPRPFFGPQAEYPAALLKTRSAGQAVVAFRIDPNGSVQDPRVKSASDPAFGVSALDAIRLWRFLPKVSDGRAVEADAEMPFEFSASQEPQGG